MPRWFEHTSLFHLFFQKGTMIPLRQSSGMVFLIHTMLIIYASHLIIEVSQNSLDGWGVWVSEVYRIFLIFGICYNFAKPLDRHAGPSPLMYVDLPPDFHKTM